MRKRRSFTNGDRFGQKEWHGGDLMTLDEALAKYGVSRQRLYQIKRDQANKAARAAKKAEAAHRRDDAQIVAKASKEAQSFIFRRQIRSSR